MTIFTEKINFERIEWNSMNVLHKLGIYKFRYYRLDDDDKEIFHYENCKRKKIHKNEKKDVQ